MPINPQTDISPEQFEILDPHLDRLKEAFYSVQEAVQGFTAAGQQHDLNVGCLYAFFRQMFDDAAATKEHADSVIDSIASMIGIPREQLEANEQRRKQNEAVLARMDGRVDPATAATARRLLLGD